MKGASISINPSAAPSEPSEPRKRHIIGHVVSLTGSHGLIACAMAPHEAGDHWSVGSLISIVHLSSRALVGVVGDTHSS